MKDALKPTLMLGLLLAVGIVGYLNLKNMKSVDRKVDTINVAAGGVENEVSEARLLSPEPLEKCYPVSSPEKLDMSTRMDFEARTSSGWVTTSNRGDPGQFCIREGPQAVRERLEEAKP